MIVLHHPNDEEHGIACGMPRGLLLSFADQHPTTSIQDDDVGSSCSEVPSQHGETFVIVKVSSKNELTTKINE